MAIMNIKEITLNALRTELASAKFSLGCHTAQLPEAEAEVRIRREDYEDYKDFPDEVRSWIKADKKKIRNIEQAIKRVRS